MAEIAENPESGKKGRAKKQSTKVDLTAMVDLAFLLITFFMFTTTLAKPKAMQIALPTDDKVEDAPQLDDDLAMTILLAPKNVVLYYFGKPENAAADANAVTATTFDKQKGIRKAILDKVKKVKEMGQAGTDKNGNSKLMVLIKGTDSSNYGNMVDILDEMHIADIKRYALIPISGPEQTLVNNAMAKVKE